MGDINEAKSGVKNEGDLEAGSERNVNGELRTIEGAAEESDVTKIEDEAHESSGEEGEHIPFLVGQGLLQKSARSPSSPQSLATPPLSPSPSPPEEASHAKEEGSHKEESARE